MSQNQPSLGFVYFWSDSPQHKLLTLLGDTSPGPKKGSQSYGGWKNVKRARRRSLKEWEGVDGLVLDIPILIDQFAASGNIEPLITELERMAGRTRPGVPDTEPPLIQFNSAGVIPHDFHREPSIEWVIEDIEWGDADRSPNGNRSRQAAVVVVGEYIEDDDLASLTSAQRRKIQKAKRNKKKGKARQKANKPRYVVKNGDTLESIAAKPTSQGGLGNASRWHEIKALNPHFRDPVKPIPAGTILTMP